MLKFTRRDTSEEDECAICLSNDNKKLYNCFVILRCQHRFHRDCLNQWLEKRPSCPICRASLKSHQRKRSISPVGTFNIFFLWNLTTSIEVSTNVLLSKKFLFWSKCVLLRQFEANISLIIFNRKARGEKNFKWCQRIFNFKSFFVLIFHKIC